MNNTEDVILLNLQMAMNKHLYSTGKITLRMYSKVNEALVTKYALLEQNDKIIRM